MPLEAPEGSWHSEKASRPLRGNGVVFHAGGQGKSGQVDQKGACIWGREETATTAWRAEHVACALGPGGRLRKEGRDGENAIGRKEARFQRGLNPTQRSLGFIQ